MEFEQIAVLVVTGLLAGAINAAVGSGSLLTYPALLSLGLPPVVANGTNSLGVVPGALSGAWVYRRELSTQWQQIKPRAVAIAIGAVAGALLVVLLPAKVFAFVVPWLILGACAVIALQPLIMKSLKPKKRSQRVSLTTMVGLGAYGGYFGAGQGIGQLAALTVLDGDDIHRANAQKNVLTAIANFVGAIVFAISGLVMWLPALIICVSSLVGGFVGGNLARLLPPWALRTVIVIVGLYAVYISFRSLR